MRLTRYYEVADSALSLRRICKSRGPRLLLPIQLRNWLRATAGIQYALSHLLRGRWGRNAIEEVAGPGPTLPGRRGRGDGRNRLPAFLSHHYAIGIPRSPVRAARKEPKKETYPGPWGRTCLQIKTRGGSRWIELIGACHWVAQRDRRAKGGSMPPTARHSSPSSKFHITFRPDSRQGSGNCVTHDLHEPPCRCCSAEGPATHSESRIQHQSLLAEERVEPQRAEAVRSRVIHGRSWVLEATKALRCWSPPHRVLRLTSIQGQSMQGWFKRLDAE